MYICLCKNVTSNQIRAAVDEGRVGCIRTLARELGVATQCGKCAQCARKVVDSCVCAKATSAPEPQLAV